MLNAIIKAQLKNAYDIERILTTFQAVPFEGRVH